MQFPTDEAQKIFENWNTSSTELNLQKKFTMFDLNRTTATQSFEFFC